MQRVNLGEPAFEYDDDDHHPRRDAPRDKVAIWTGNADDDVIVERSSRVDYWHGER